MTSIIITVGPSSIEPSKLKKLKLCGADRFRINLSHATHSSLEEYINIIKSVGITPSIDTQGAQLRIKSTSLFESIPAGDIVNLYFTDEYKKITHDNEYIALNHPEAVDQIIAGDIMKVDFNGLALEILEQTGDNCLKAKTISSGSVLKNRAVDIQSKSLKLSVLTEFDKEAIKYALSNGIKEVYASFISTESDARYLRDIIGKNIKLISKIETSMGIANVSKIIDLSDEILIDRGDLSREISIAAIPMAVFNVIKIAREKRKPVNIATNVLDSMMKASLPSRAEISDIYSHLSAGVSGIVLAAEVAIGDNPVSSTALLKYLIDSYKNYERGFHGIGKINKPCKELIGDELFNWL
ncbi:MULTISPECIES: pyruvate kinase [Prochlorococcus]|uniref:pyruvate kinase n=1 Tax=Prochlorococcus TaxID=1218 RepID=UPI000533B38E|nr:MULTISPECIES: pyruvate kinase [Prochlorococcus]KGG12072.1 Pyruvate kinase [Prochlorococcus sp. MIT 0601]